MLVVAMVVDLDLSTKFTAARGRNAGWERLVAEHPELELIQFVDGDCEVAPGWIEHAIELMRSEPEVAAVFGFRRERYPERSMYNRMCDVEWRIDESGPAQAFGGDVMIRVSALKSVGGYDPSLIAGEDPELAMRIREEVGGMLLRVDREMTIHDADMHRISQWWSRAERSGHAYAELSHRSLDPDRSSKSAVRRIAIWGLLAPAAGLALSLPTLGLSTGVFARYPLVALRGARQSQRRGLPMSHGIAWGAHLALAPFPQLIGVLRFHRNRLLGRTSELIEYKAPNK